ncbi:MAG: hypothetical protein AB7Y46_18440, partial [Armatimonadota bacterium]
YVPAELGLERLVALYWAGSFQQQLHQTPVARGRGLSETWTTRTISAADGIYSETVFTLCGDVLWVLSLTTTADLRTDAAPDLGLIANEFTLF